MSSAKPHDMAETPSRLARLLGKAPTAEAYKQTAAFSLFLSMAVFCQWLSRAYTTSFGEFPDEPGHYLTAVMIRVEVPYTLRRTLEAARTGK
jgi:hypothetical protein